MFGIDKLSVLEAFIRLSQLSWTELNEIFPYGKCSRSYIQRLSYVIKQLDDEGLISPIHIGSMRWTVKPAAYEVYKQLLIEREQIKDSTKKTEKVN